MFGFAAAWWLEQSPGPQYALLIDPILLIKLGIAVLPIPGKIMLDSLREVILMAPPNTVVNEIERRLLQILSNVRLEHIEVRVSTRSRSRGLCY